MARNHLALMETGSESWLHKCCSHKRQEVTSPAKQQSTSQVELCCLEMMVMLLMVVVEVVAAVALVVYMQSEPVIWITTLCN
jgi:heme/copper-type cytochrome/quinol oxidase subunit 2